MIFVIRGINICFGNLEMEEIIFIWGIRSIFMKIFVFELDFESE